MNDNNTVVFEDNQFETVVGDEKQPDFYPRVKVKRWDNEVNFSVGVIDDGGTADFDGKTVTWTKDSTTATFYPIDQQNTYTPLKIRRVVKNGQLSPTEASSEYEVMRTLPKDTLKETITIADYVCPPCICVFDLMPTRRYMEVDENGDAKDFNYADKSTYGDGRNYPVYDKVPVCRIYSPYSASANPYYVDEGLHNIDIQYGHNDVPYINNVWINAIKIVVESKGIKVYQKEHPTKLFFKDGDRLVKFHSAENARGVLACYININCEYNKCYDFYKPDVEKDVRNEYAYGLQAVNPNIDHTIVDEIIEKFAELMNVQIDNTEYTAAEKNVWDTVKNLHTDVDWIRDGVRTDANWWYRHNRKGFEFEITLDEKPTTNIYPLSIKTKGLTFYKQNGPTYEERCKEFASCDPDVIGSYAVYHAEGKENNEYQTGKAFHIYRPIANDSNGWHIFCDMEIDIDNEILNITIPQNFLDTAVYPITIDPTFGYTSAGASTSANIDNIYGSLFTPPPVATWDSISAYIDWTTHSSTSINLGVYKDSDDTLVTSVEADDATNTFDDWVTLPLDGVTERVSLGDVVLCSWATATAYSPAVNLHYDVVTNFPYKNKNVTYSATYPSPITWGVESTGREYSIYVTYTISDRNVNITDGENNPKGVKIWP